MIAMMRRASKILILTVAGLFACAPFAAASPSVVDQYTEQVPTAGGEVPSNGGTTPTTGNPSDGGDPGGGPTAGSTGGTPLAGGGTSPGTATGGTTQGSPNQTGAAPETGESSTRADGSAATGGEEDGGIGIFLPILIVAIAGAAVFLAIQRRRGSGPATS